MLALNAALIATAFGLYYLGSETFRRWASDLHIGVGLSLPILLAVHVLLGRHSVRATRRQRQRWHAETVERGPGPLPRK